MAFLVDLKPIVTQGAFVGVRVFGCGAVSSLVAGRPHLLARHVAEIRLAARTELHVWLRT